MEQLLAEYTFPEIITFLACFVLAAKGIWDLFDYFKDKYKEKFNKDYESIKKEENIEEAIKKVKEQHKESLDIYEKLEKKLNNISNSIDSINDTINGLVVSDKLDIKQFIVREYHFFVEKQKWIDDYSLDCILLRYEIYKKEGGNSYIDSLINEIKKLPKHPPVQ